MFQVDFVSPWHWPVITIITITVAVIGFISLLTAHYLIDLKNILLNTCAQRDKCQQMEIKRRHLCVEKRKKLQWAQLICHSNDFLNYHTQLVWCAATCIKQVTKQNTLNKQDIEKALQMLNELLKWIKKTKPKGNAMRHLHTRMVYGLCVKC